MTSERQRTERAAMLHAIEVSQHGIPTASPNPLVGCVILNPAGETVGVGWHEVAGGPHAEVMALTNAGDAAKGGTAVVTLEPCAHTGRTGPCTQALIDAGIVRVVFAVADPNGEAAGGADALRAADVEVVDGIEVETAEAANVAWLHAMRHQRPFVTWKFAGSLDGRSSAPDGTSRWISGPESRHDAHRLRRENDAILVGTGTILTDDPHLTSRDVEGRLTLHQPVRVVVGERETPADARVRDAAADTMLISNRDPHEVLKQLHKREIRSVLLEGGPTVAAAFVTAGVVDRVVAYIAPVLLGGGTPAVAGLGIGTIDQALRLSVDDITRMGDDIRITGTLPSTAQEA